MRIGIDLDGCAYDFTRALRKWLVDREGFDPKRLGPATCWEFYEKDWGLSAEDFLRYCNEGVNGNFIFAVGVPMTGTLLTLDRLKEAGHTLHIVTDRSFGTKSHTNTAFWLASWGVPFDSLTFSGDKTSVPTDAFIDDRPENVDALRAAGVSAWLLDQKRTDQAGHPYLIRSWPEFERKVAAHDQAARFIEATEGKELRKC